MLHTACPFCECKASGKTVSNGLTLNDSGAAVAEQLFCTVTMNLSPMIRHDTLEGRAYIVVPMVMLTEGVHNGSNGPLFYPGAELAKTPAVWNHKPIIVYHPASGMSGCDPDVLNNRKIGLILNTKYVGNKLHAEAWLEIDRIKTVDERILTALEAGEMVELSTGLFTDNESIDGEFDGEAYNAIARNYRPDHLAILPDKKGACSIDDGAGLLRLNEASFSRVREQLWSALKNAFGIDADVWVEDIFGGFFIYSKDGKLFKQDYTSTDVESTFVGEPVEVIRVTEYRTTDGVFVGNAERIQNMDKKKFIDGLIKNSEWTEEDRTLLMGMTEPQLKRLEVEAPKTNADPKPKTIPTTPPKADPIKNADPAPKVEPKKDAPITADAYIANAPEGIRDMLSSGLATHNQQKLDVATAIAANERNVFTPEQLAAKSLGELQAIAALLPPAENAAPNYGGAGFADQIRRNVSGNSATPEPMASTPEITFAN